MRPFSLPSLRVSLTLLLVVAGAPALGIALHSASEDSRRETELGVQSAIQLARLVAFEENQGIESARRMLTVLASAPEVLSGNEETCNAYLAGLADVLDPYANLGVVDLGGNVVCSALPVPAHARQWPLSV